MVVERQLAAAGSNLGRRELGREAFVAKVWEWKAQSGGTIARQMRRLGDSPDWSRERFTMDEGLSRAVIRGLRRPAQGRADLQGQAAGQLGLRSCRPRSPTSRCSSRRSTAISGICNYPIEGSDGEFITVATTRPETMLGDTGVAVHPEDERYRHLHGRFAHPAAGRPPDPDRGRRAIPTREGHRRGQDHAGPRLQRFRGRPPSRARGDLDPGRGRARQRATRRRPIAGSTGSRRGGASSRISRRWGWWRRSSATGTWCRTATARARRWSRSSPTNGTATPPTLAKEAIAAVEDGRTRFVPRQWENTYFEWMRNIQPWCISRQLWWGHQIPAWYGPDGQVFVAESEAEASTAAGGTLRSRRSSCAATRTCSTPGSPPACGRSRRWAGRSRRPSWRGSTRPACWSPASTSSSSGSPG